MSRLATHLCETHHVTYVGVACPLCIRAAYVRVDPERYATARRLIQSAYDRLVEHWGNDGSTLKDDQEYVPDLNLIRDMYQWLQEN